MNDWKDILKAVAPALATVLGGPLAGIAIKVLGDAVLGDPNASEQAIADAVVAMSPADLVKLKIAEKDFAVQMKQLDIDVYKVDQSDRVSARDFWKSVLPSERMLLFCLAGMVLSGFIYTVWWVLNPRAPLPEDATRLTLIGTVIGYMSAKADQVVNYFFGSSSGSREKTDALNKAVDNLTKDSHR